MEEAAANGTHQQDDQVRALYTDFHADLSRYLLHLTRSPELAEDLEQTVWTKVVAIRRRDSRETGSTNDGSRDRIHPSGVAAHDVVQLPGPAQRRAFLRVMALNVYRDWYRKAKTLSIEDLAAKMFNADDDREADNGMLDRLLASRSQARHFERVSDLFSIVLSAFASDESPAHQTVAFGFNKPLQWNPSEVAALATRPAGEQRLCELGRALESEIGTAYSLSLEKKSEVFRAFFHRLRQPVAWEHVTAPIAAETLFRQYFRSADAIGMAKEVGHWSASVQRRIVGKVAEAMAGNRAGKERHG